MAREPIVGRDQAYFDAVHRLMEAERNLGAARDALNMMRGLGEGPQYVSVTEAAHRLGVHKNTVRNYLRNGSLRYTRLGNRPTSRILIPIEELTAVR